MSGRRSRRRGRAVWQLGADMGHGSFADLLVRHDLALVGPGDTGPWAPGAFPGRWGRRFVARIAEEMRVGDIVLLRTNGWDRVGAVGVVASGYLFLPQCHSVAGWDVQHARRVRWFGMAEPAVFGDLSFRGDVHRLSRVEDPPTAARARSAVADIPDGRWTAPLAALPAEEPAADLPAELAGVVAEVGDREALRRRRDCFGEGPGAPEILAHQVVPVLAALGWRPDQIALGWSYRNGPGGLVGVHGGNHADLAVFSDLPRVPEHCRFLVLAKRPNGGAGFARRDARRRLLDMKLPCDFVVTDGTAYRYFEAAEDHRQVAYADLSRPRRSAAELFQRLRAPAPNW